MHPEQAYDKVKDTVPNTLKNDTFQKYICISAKKSLPSVPQQCKSLLCISISDAVWVQCSVPRPSKPDIRFLSGKTTWGSKLSAILMEFRKFCSLWKMGWDLYLRIILIQDQIRHRIVAHLLLILLVSIQLPYPLRNSSYNTSDP